MFAINYLFSFYSLKEIFVDADESYHHMHRYFIGY